MIISNGEIHTNHGVCMGTRPVGLATHAIAYGPGERESVTRTAQEVWADLYTKAGKPYFRGIVRADLVPSLTRVEYGSFGLSIYGIYELNTGSPECAMAASVACIVEPQSHTVDAAAIIARQIMRVYGHDQEVVMVIGNNKVKRLWGFVYVAALRQAGLRVTVMSEKEAMKAQPELIWRFGDVRKDGECHYGIRFTRWLCNRPTESVFNTVLADKKDMGRKSFLLSSADSNLCRLYGSNRALRSKDDAQWSIEGGRHTHLVLKPDGGASGNGIYFGRNFTDIEWHDVSLKLLEDVNRYSFWQLRMLPKVTISGVPMAVDLNPTFFADGDKLTYLYTICRVQDWATYKENLTINVAQGAGFAPVFV